MNASQGALNYGLDTLNSTAEVLALFLSLIVTENKKYRSFHSLGEIVQLL